MYKYEDLYLKICDNFHNEINQVLIEIEPSAKENYWFEKKSIHGKFYIIKDILLSLNGNDIFQYQLVNLQNILKKYKTILDAYFESHNIATCFVYFSPENTENIKDYFLKISEYSPGYSSCMDLHFGYSYMIGIEIIGFPNDCTFKLSASLRNGKISIEDHYEPLFEIEKEKGKHIGNPQISRKYHNELELEILMKNPELWEKKETNEKKRFEIFAHETRDRIINLMDDFKCCNDLCNSFIDSIMNDTPFQNLQELERIYSVLKVTYIKDSFEKFVSIFNSNYSGEKLIWLKSGPQLKYFIDQLNGKLKISDEINKWAGIRIEMNTSVKDLSIYLRKQTTKGEYQLLNQGNRKKDPLFKLFREH